MLIAVPYCIWKNKYGPLEIDTVSYLFHSSIFNLHSSLESSG